MRKRLTIFCCNFRFRAVQKCDNLVDLRKCCKMSIYLQNFMPIQPRTSFLKFGHLAAKSGKGTALYLSTKAPRGAAPGGLPRRRPPAASAPRTPALFISQPACFVCPATFRQKKKNSCKCSAFFRTNSRHYCSL